MHHYQNLSKIRALKGLSQKDIANVLSIAQQQYALYESGKRELPMHHFITLAKFYNISLDYLAGLIDEPRELDTSKKE